MTGAARTRPEVEEHDQSIHREIAPGVHWLCGCLALAHKDTTIHSYASPYLVLGSERTLLVDTGYPGHWDGVERKTRELLDGRPLDFIFPTHPELPHAGNLSRLLSRHPDCQVVGDVRDLHIYFPELEDKLVPQRPGDQLDLGDRSVTFREAILRDLPNTLWGYDDKAGVLFVADGFGFSHYHGVGDCGKLAEELAHEITTEQVAFLNDAALSWIRYRDLAPIMASVSEAMEQLDVRVIAPAHGSVMANAGATFQIWVDRLLEGQALKPPTTPASTERKTW